MLENQKRESEPMMLKALLANTLSGTWPKVAIGVFAAELVILFVVSGVPLSQSTVNQISGQNTALGNTAASLGLFARALFIFSNNLSVAGLQFVPMLGWYIFGYSMYNTALSINVIGIVNHLPGPLVMSSLLLQPHSWLELPAYAIATTQSFFLVSTAVRRGRFKFEAARTPLVFGIVAVELFIAALFESLEITLSYSTLLEFVIPWALFAIVLGLFFGARRWLLKTYKSDVSQQRITTSATFPNAVRFCPKCGANIPETESTNFCPQCGEKLPQPNQEEAYPSH